MGCRRSEIACQFKGLALRRRDNGDFCQRLGEERMPIAEWLWKITFIYDTLYNKNYKRAGCGAASFGLIS